MGKKNKTVLGRALIKDKYSSNRGRKTVDDNTMLHTTEIQDGYDWGRLNLQSVTEESSFQEFLSTAELAGTEFQAEKLNVTFVNPKVNVGLLTGAEKIAVQEEQHKNKDLLKIPRRPKWTVETTPEQLEINERDQFLQWRRQLAILQENEGLLLTPYEKNLEFWRQLWRVVERSDVIVQIVDARNPLLFRCEDLEKYVKEVGCDKMNLILANKADFLSEQQRETWAKHFGDQGVRVAFFSATLAAETVELDDIQEGDESEGDAPSDDIDSESNSDHESTGEADENVAADTIRARVNNLESKVNQAEQNLNQILKQLSHIVENVSDERNEIVNDPQIESDENSGNQSNKLINSGELLSRDRLIELFKTIHVGTKVTKGVTTVGLVGYPNVGKSSTINTLMTVKKVSVSATPGKTKHFQTLFLDKDILLCDCPGLVMPSFVLTKAEMVVNGILPIDQMRDHVPPVNLVASVIPRHIIEERYGIMITKPMEGEDENRSPTAEELLNAFGYNRGFMTANGQPDCPRSARYVLKDFVNGRLLYCTAPPGVEQTAFHQYPEKKTHAERILPPREQRAIKIGKLSTADLDNTFFAKNTTGAHAKGVLGKTGGLPTVRQENGDGGSISGSTQSLLTTEKPWKKLNKHGNKKKKEKLRRIYSHLDKH